MIRQRFHADRWLGFSHETLKLEEEGENFGPNAFKRAKELKGLNEFNEFNKLNNLEQFDRHRPASEESKLRGEQRTTSHQNLRDQSLPQKRVNSHFGGDINRVHFHNSVAAAPPFYESFLIPEWSGDGLISRNAMRVKEACKILDQDCSWQFNGGESFNQSLKKSIYNEFERYREEQIESCDSAFIGHHIERESDFWNHLKTPSSILHEILQQFISLYLLKVVNIYLYKVRFIVNYGEKTGDTVGLQQVLNPSSFFRRVFPQGSANEMICSCMQINEYGWYRPSGSIRKLIGKIMYTLKDLSSSEIEKICSARINKKGSYYPHSLGQKYFGTFLNCLLIDLPNWNKKEDLKGMAPGSYGNRIKNEVHRTDHLGIDNLGTDSWISGRKRYQTPLSLNLLFTGDHLPALGLGHWLAQEENLKENLEENLRESSEGTWREVLTPDFEGEGMKTSSYLRITQELQFLSFLLKLATKQKYIPRDLITSIMRQKKLSQGRDFAGQFNLFSTDGRGGNYQRILLNLASLPKNNPHHYVANQIQQRAKTLSPGGLLLVLTNQNFFLPSQSERVKTTLRGIKFECQFSFEQLRGRGEIPQYLYIFSAKPAVGSRPHDYSLAKESCTRFHLSGELEHFASFASFVSGLKEFFSLEGGHNIPIFQKDLGKGLQLGVFRDAIVDGKLLGQSKLETDQVTHPSFFKNLTEGCISFEELFDIEIINEREELAERHFASDLLGIRIGLEEQFPYVMIVDFRNRTETFLDIIPSSAYRAKAMEMGRAYFQYFALRPKRHHLDINLFREYFRNPIGHQIVQFSLHGTPSKVKSRLRSLLIPRFMGEFRPPRFEINLNSEYSTFLKEKELRIKLRKDYPAYVLAKLCELKNLVEEKLSEFLEGREHAGEALARVAIDFSDKNIQEEFLKLPTSPLYPKHEEIFIELKIRSKKELSLPLTGARFERDP